MEEVILVLVVGPAVTAVTGARDGLHREGDTFGSNGSTIARTHSTSGEPKTSTRVKFWTRAGATQVAEAVVQLAPVVVLTECLATTLSGLAPMTYRDSEHCRSPKPSYKYRPWRC